MIPPRAPSPVRASSLRAILWSVPLALALAACGQQKPKQPPHPTPTVGVMVATPTSAAMTTELPGRTEAYLASDVRPQISGIIQRRLFTEGTIVHRGQALYQIDPSVYRAAVAQARAQLANAQANAQTTQSRAERYTGLEKINAVAKQDAEDARASAEQAAAQVQQYRAALQSAEINLRYTTVRAPITGRIGRSAVTPGALVTADQTTALATISALDPIYVDIQQSADQLLALRKAVSAGGVVPDHAPVRLKFGDGSEYGATGTLEFAEVTVDPSTGAVTLRARFPNPQNLLLPGLFVRAVLSQAVRRDVFLLPELAVQHDPTGGASVLLVDDTGKVSVRDVQTQGIQNGKWVVTSGLAAGDRVVVEGVSKAKPGQTVNVAAGSGAPSDAGIIDHPKGGAGGSSGGSGGGGSGGAGGGQGATGAAR